MRIRLDKTGGTYELQAPTWEGGEAWVFVLKALPSLALKIYRKPTTQHQQKLDAMLANPPVPRVAAPGHVPIAWPTERVHEAGRNGAVIGYAMPLVSGARCVADVFHPQKRAQAFPGFGKAELLNTAREIAAAFRAVHARGHVIGDVNELNVLVTPDAHVTLVDADSFQIINKGQVFRCLVGKGRYTPPELLGVRYADIDRAPMHDNFALAVLIFQLLMNGIHPFDAVYTHPGDPPSVQARIAAGHWPYGKRALGVYRPSPHAPPFDKLPNQVQSLFRQCFEEGHDNPGKRPDAAAWEEALRTLDPPPPPPPPPPSLAAIQDQVVSVGVPVNVWLSATDPSGRPLTFNATATQAGAVIAIAGNLVSVTLPAGYVGTFSATVTASNGFAVAVQSFRITVIAPARPNLTAIPDQKVRCGVPLIVTLDVTDPSGLAVTLSATASQPAAVVGIQGNRLRVALPAWQLGTFIVTVAASNGFAKTSRTFFVTVTLPWRTVIACAVALLALCGGAAWLIGSRFSRNGPSVSEHQQASQRPAATQQSPTARSSGEIARSSTPRTPPATLQAAVRPEDARKWIDKECTVEMTVRSTRDLGWAVVLNSKSPYTDPENLSIAIVKENTESQFREQGIANVEQHFRPGSIVQVTGKVEELHDKRTDRPYLEIKVRKVEQIKKKP
jgi:serine/threonine protein kinase